MYIPRLRIISLLKSQKSSGGLWIISVSEPFLHSETKKIYFTVPLSFFLFRIHLLNVSISFFLAEQLPFFLSHGHTRVRREQGTNVMIFEYFRRKKIGEKMDVFDSKSCRFMTWMIMLLVLERKMPFFRWILATIALDTRIWPEVDIGSTIECRTTERRTTGDRILQHQTTRDWRRTSKFG
jgi:hypothetical protein